LKNLYKLQAIKGASNDAALASALKLNPTIDANKVASDIGLSEDEAAGVRSYLSVAGVEGGFKADPNAWQNLSFGDFVARESTDDFAWPFLLGFGYAPCY
jgi:hypothetical protein